jgi:glycosyltransferase involved in cell wall biosynthesis
MTEQPLVSVIMNCCNGEKYLQEAIDSVLAQTYKNWEIVFWDNQSIDDTAQIAKSYDDPRIKYHRSESFTPLGEARNQEKQ